MIKCLKAETTRILRHPMFYVSLIIGVGICVWLFIDQIIALNNFQNNIQLYGTEKLGLYYPDSVYNKFIGLDYYDGQTNILYSILPFLACLSFSSSYLNDQKTGYIQNIVTRSSFKTYKFSKFITVFCSGFFVTFIILIFDFALTCTAFPLLPPECITATYPASFSGTMWTDYFVNHPMLYTISYIVIDSMYMGLISLVSMIIGLFIHSSFIAICGGPVFYHLVCSILSSTLDESMVPVRFLLPYQPAFNIQFSYILIEFSIILIPSILLFFLKERKKDVLSI